MIRTLSPQRCLGKSLQPLLEIFMLLMIPGKSLQPLLEIFMLLMILTGILKKIKRVHYFTSDNVMIRVTRVLCLMIRVYKASSLREWYTYTQALGLDRSLPCCVVSTTHSITHSKAQAYGINHSNISFHRISNILNHSY